MAYILLTSAKHDSPNTRSFNEFKTTDELAQALIAHFEDYLLTKERCDNNRLESTDDDSLEYKSDDLYKFLDDFFGELCCLVRHEDDHKLFIPYPKDWIKENCIYIYLRGQHDKSGSSLPEENMNSASVRPQMNMDVDGVC